MDKDALNKQFDAYIKKTIKNTVINYKKYEERKRHREMSMEELNQDISVPFLFSLTHSLEDYFENVSEFSVQDNEVWIGIYDESGKRTAYKLSTDLETMEQAE